MPLTGEARQGNVSAFCAERNIKRGRKTVPLIIMGTSKNRFEKGKWVECAECDESRRSKAVCLTRRFEEAVGALYTFSLKQGF